MFGKVLLTLVLYLLSEAVTGDDSGIEGILSRLEKERNINFGFSLREKENTTHLQSDHDEDDWPAGTSKDVVSWFYYNSPFST